MDFLSDEQFDEVINNFRALDLKSCSDRDIMALFDNLKYLPVVAYEFENWINITRLRLNNNEGKSYSTKEELWHPPNHLNNKYQRASNPRRNAFYGSIIPPEDKIGVIESSRIPTFMESSDLVFKTTEKIEEEVFTYSQWTPNRNLNIVCAFDFEANKDDNRIINSVRNAYKKSISDNPKVEYQFREFSKYMASEFGKKAEGLDYRISSFFTEIIMDIHNFDAVLYPSFKTDFKGYNIAIKNEVVESDFELLHVLQCRHYRYCKYSLVNNEYIATNINKDGTFELRELNDPRYNLESTDIENVLKSEGQKTCN